MVEGQRKRMGIRDTKTKGRKRTRIRDVECRRGGNTRKIRKERTEE